MKIKKHFSVILFGLAVIFSLTVISRAAEDDDDGSIKPFRLAEGETRVVETDYRIKDIAVGDPEVADIKVRTGTEFLVNGIAGGVTTIQVWDSADVMRDSFSVEVSKSLVPADLIEIQCQVIEVKTGELLDLGIEWVERISFEEGSVPGIVKLGTLQRLDKLTAALNAAVEEGYGRILAKPKLVARSGGEADFLVGGELPIPVPQGDGNIAIQYKEYGVTLYIKPEGDKKRELIDVDLTVEASTIDHDNAVVIDGYTIPAIASRNTETSVQVDDGDTIVLSGLKQLEEKTTSKGIPVLSKIPILGNIFKFESTDDKETEVTVFMTPKFHD
ncbi:MAG: type II and III secretion system protein family protein [Elusimicrobiota bacterium]